MSETNSSDRGPQLLLYKVGVLGSAPLDFPLRLAEAFDMDYISSDELRGNIVAAQAGNGLTQQQARKINMKYLNRLMGYEMHESLGEGVDVVADRFFNTPRSRLVPTQLARNFGALSIAVWCDVPEGLAYSRVERWTQQNAFTNPIDQWEVPPVIALDRMYDGLFLPTNGEPIDHIIKLDGRGDTDGLLDQFDREFGRIGLLKYFDIADD